MKKIFSQMGQWIFRHRKKLIYGALVLVVSQICFFDIGGIGVENQVFADAANNTNTATENPNFQTKVTQWRDTFSFFKSIIYVVMYPILIMAGKFVDNSMVYGSIFGFDAVLWRLRVIVRNLANYGLGFLFLFKIFEYLIGKGKVDFKKDILVPALIAGVGINASWFLMAALLDVSTIATYGIGGLPIKMLGGEDDSKKNADGSDKKEYNPYVWPTIVVYDAKEPTTVKRFLSTGDTYISECAIFTYAKDNDKKEDLILAPKYIAYSTGVGDGIGTQPLKCHYDNQVYYFSNLFSEIRRQNPGSGNQVTYATNLEAAKRNLTGFNEVAGLIKQGIILQIGDAHASGGIVGPIFTGAYSTGQKYGQDVDNMRSGEGENNYGLKKLKDSVDNAGFVGVFSSLYASLMEAGWDLKVSGATDDGTYVSLLNVALGLGHMLAVSIPLIVMMIVFILRIGVLWMAITLSPFIVLLTAFKLDKLMEKVDLLKYLQIGNLIPIIFSPVVICFAVSLSTVLVRIITTLNFQEIITEPSILGGIVTINIAGMLANIGKMVVSIMGIAITRFLMWAAIESSKLGEIKLVQNLKDLAENTMGSIPIVPIPGKDGQITTISANTAFGLNGKDDIVSTMIGNVKREYNEQDTAAVNALLGLDKEKRNNAIAEDYIKASGGIGEIVKNKDWQTNTVTLTAYNPGPTTFNKLDPEVQKIINQKIEEDKNKKKEGEKEGEEKNEESKDSST